MILKIKNQSNATFWKSLFHWVMMPLCVFVLFSVLLGPLYAADVDLKALINETPAGGSIRLDPANTYYLNSETWLKKSITIDGNGAAMEFRGIGPIYLREPGAILTVLNATLKSDGWGALASEEGGTIIVKGCSISCPNGTGIFVRGAHLTLENSTVSSCVFGINIYEGVSGAGAVLNGVNISDCPFAVQAVGVLSSVTIDQNSTLTYFGRGTGVGLIEGASGIVRNSSIYGFSNGIDKLEPSSLRPVGTAKAVNCYFNGSGVAAFSVNYAKDVLFSNCTVENVVEDGIWFRKCTGIIENSKILDSAMTGVTIWGCDDGATIRNCVIKNSGHQGLSVVSSDDAEPIPSLGVQVIGNTILNSQMTNLWVDSISTARLQGNIFWKSPGTAIRLHGPKEVYLESALVGGSAGGFEIKGQSSPQVTLSAIIINNIEGALVYDGSLLTVTNSILWANNQGTTTGWSIYSNDGARVLAKYCAFGGAGDNALWNNTGNTFDVTYSFWDSSDGPSLGDRGNGAVIDWNDDNNSKIVYSPFLTETPLFFNLNSNVAMPSGGAVNWNSSIGTKIDITANTGSTPLESEIIGALRIIDTDHLQTVTPPSNLISGQLYVVWVSTLMRLNSRSGTITFELPSQTGTVSLQRRDADGNWQQVPSTWDYNAGVLTYSPGDIHSLNGTFGLIGYGTTVYVCSDGICGGMANCYTTVESAAGAAESGSIINVANDVTYKGDFAVSGKNLIMQGGWDAAFQSRSGISTLQGFPTVSNGSLTTKQVKVIP